MEFEDQHQRRVEEEEEDEEDEEEGSDEMMMMNNNHNGSSSNRVKMVEALSQVQIQPTATMVAPPLISTKPRYRDCMRNHAINVMGYAVDGCCEFMPAGAEGSPEALKCAACGCHRNFHRMEEMGKPTLLYSNHVPFGSYHRAPALHLGQPRQLALPLPPPGGAGAGRSPSRGEDGDVSTDPNGGAMVVIGSGSGLKKRFRTKFSPEQKAAMLAMAERLGWRMQKCDEELVQQFCHETAVKRQVFKVWMHNNKHSLGKTNDSSTSNTSRRLQLQQQPEN